MSIIRISHDKNNPYVILNKSPLEDKELSWAAKGLWSYLMSRPDNWSISVAHLSKIYEAKGGGEKAIYSLLNELIDIGYCTRTQENKEGSFGKVDYTITEFKKCLPHSLQADAHQADAREGSLTNKGSVLSKEQQQQKKSVAVFFDCLMNVDILEQDKVWLSKTYDEPMLKLAISWATHPKIKINQSICQAIKWFCKQNVKPEIPKNESDESATNKKFAQEMEIRIIQNEHFGLSALNEYVEIYQKGGISNNFVLYYSEKGFLHQLENAMRKRNLLIKK